MIDWLIDPIPSERVGSALLLGIHADSLLPETQAFEHLLNHVTLVDEGDNPHLALTGGADEGTGATFRRAPDFDATVYAREAFGITRGEKILRVRLLFESKVAVYIMEREWHPTQTFIQRADGRVEMCMATSGRQELIRWILSWMPDVRVLAPKSLKDRIEEKLRDGLALQSGIEEVSTSSSSGQAAEL
mgnify:CR=1 FL=1